MKLLEQVTHSLSEAEVLKVAKSLEFYSASDISNLVKEAAMEPLRSYSVFQVIGISKHQIRNVSVKDFESAKKTVPPSLAKKDVQFYVEWEKKFSSANR